MPYCLQIIEKAQTSTSQISPIYNEALSASLIIAIYLNSDISTGKYIISIGLTCFNCSLPFFQNDSEFKIWYFDNN